MLTVFSVSLNYEAINGVMRLFVCVFLGGAESMVAKRGLYLNFERVQSSEAEFCPDQHILPSGTTVFRIGD